ncbi:MAG: hypothetical protein KDA33_15920 [Phycisphaerales bacterium]|nr:hypothetical protein [Phycisphaerales bacterium]
MNSAYSVLLWFDVHRSIRPVWRFHPACRITSAAPCRRVADDYRRF